MGPGAVIERSGFVNLVSTLDAAYQILSRKHIMKVLYNMYDNIKTRLQGELGIVENVVLTTDFSCHRFVPGADS